MSFSDEVVQAVWNKGTAVAGYNSNDYRKDKCGAWMSRSHYGDRSSILGWEVDHIYPEAKGGSDDLSNLQPLQWDNNLQKGDDLQWSCKITSSDKSNVLA